MALAAQSQPIHGFNEKAHTFITEMKDEKEHTCSTFVLNTEDFAKLQLYIQSGLTLPKNEAAFEAAYPRAAFKKYMGKDPELYDALKTKIPHMYEHYKEFSGKIVNPMIELGQSMSEFAKKAIVHTNAVYYTLEFISSPEVGKGEPTVEAAKIFVGTVLLRYIDYSETAKVKCTTLATNLNAFKSGIEHDHVELENLIKRFNESLPDKGKQAEMIRDLCQQNRDIVAKATERQKNAQAMEKKQLDKMNGRLILGRLFWRSEDKQELKRIQEQVKRLEKQKEKYEKEGEAELTQLSSAFETVNALNGSLKDLCDTVHSVTTTVEHMQDSFGCLTDYLKEINGRLETIEGDIDKEHMEERLVSLEDLDKARKTWDSVQKFADQFQSQGLIDLAQIDSEAQK